MEEQRQRHRQLRAVLTRGIVAVCLLSLAHTFSFPGIAAQERDYTRRLQSMGDYMTSEVQDMMQEVFSSAPQADLSASSDYSFPTPSSGAPPVDPTAPYYMEDDESSLQRVYEDKVTTDPEVYEYIVVGCGASGCPLAGYLANQGHKVLVLERGLSRREVANAVNIGGAGIGQADPTMTQVLTTRKGVRTHVAAVMGGSTTTDSGTYIQEDPSYFDYLNMVYGAGWDKKMLQSAIREHLAQLFYPDPSAHIMPPDMPFGVAVAEAMRQKGFVPLGGRIPLRRSWTLRMGKMWASASLFNWRTGLRRAADFFVHSPYLRPDRQHYLTVRSGHNVVRVEWEKVPGTPRANCVVYRPTVYKDIKPQGRKDLLPEKPASYANWKPWFKRLFDPEGTFFAENTTPREHPYFLAQGKKFRRACIGRHPNNRIILSAGAVQSPAILYRSGVGPKPQLKKIKVEPVLEIPDLGQELIDRVVIPVSMFRQHYKDKVIPIPRTAIFMSDGTDTAEVRELRTKRKGDRQDARKSKKEDNDSGERGRRHILEGIKHREETDSGIKVMAADTDSDQSDEPLGTREVKETGDDASTQVDSRIFLPPKPNLPPEISAAYLDPFKPWMGSLEPGRVCQATGIRLAGPHCPHTEYHHGHHPHHREEHEEAGRHHHGDPYGAYQLSQSTLSCTALPIGELSGGRIAEGIVYASRFILPPRYRNDPVTDAIFEVLQACSEHKAPFGLLFLKPICAIAFPAIMCLRKVYTTFYYTAQPRSRGSVRLDATGELLVNGNYLKHEQDLFDAVRGVSTMIGMANSNSYRHIVDTQDKLSCPASVLNGMLDIMLTIASSSSVFMTKPKNFYYIQEHLELLVPVPHRRLRRTVRLGEDVVPRVLKQINTDRKLHQDGASSNVFEFDDYQEHVIENLDVAKMEQLGIKRRLEEVGFDFASYERYLRGYTAPETDTVGDNFFMSRRLEKQLEEHLMNAEDKYYAAHATKTTGATERRLQEQAVDSVAYRRAVEECEKECFLNDEGDLSESCPATDVCCVAFGNARCIATHENQHYQAKHLADDEELPSRAVPSPGSSQYPPPPSNWEIDSITAPQWAATFPPRLPRPYKPKDIAKYALSYMTSTGEHANTIPMGKTVDSFFDLRGVERVSVIDSSVLNELPRMNPASVQMALGIYGGMKKVQQRRVPW